MADDDENPMSLPESVLELIAKDEDVVRYAGLKPHMMRRQIETAVDAYRVAVATGDAATIAAAEDVAIRRAAKCMEELAAGAIRLLEEVRDRKSSGAG